MTGAVEGKSAAARRTGVALALLVAAALAVRLAALWLARDASPWNDQVTYVQRAEDLLDGKGYTGSYQSWVRHTGEGQLASLPRYRGAYQAPGFSAFIALVYALAGRDPAWVKLAQVLLGAATTYFVYALGRDAFGERAGLAAGWLYALDPTLVAFTHYLFNETLFIALFTPALWLLARRGAPPSARATAAAALLLAGASYVKSSSIPLLPLLAAWLVWLHRARWRAALRAAALGALVWSACVAPWTLRNRAVHGGFVLMDSSWPYNFWRGNQAAAYEPIAEDAHKRFPPPFSAFHVSPVSEVGGAALVAVARERYGVERPTDLQVVKAANRRALESILGDVPGFLRRAWYKIVDTWNPTSFVMRHMEKGGYGALGRGWIAAISWACAASYALTMALALPALWSRRRDGRAVLVCLLVAYFTALHAVTFGLTRFRLPLMPFLAVFAGVAAITLLDRVRAWRSA